MEKYLRNDSEQKQEPQAETRPELETQPNLQEAGIETNRREPSPAIEKAPEIDLTEPLAEISQEPTAIIDKGAEPNYTYELPVADLELLLIELDADALEVRPEKNIEAEAGPEQ
jgi:hypothetical protein